MYGKKKKEIWKKNAYLVYFKTFKEYNENI